MAHTATLRTHTFVCVCAYVRRLSSTIYDDMNELSGNKRTHNRAEIQKTKTKNQQRNARIVRVEKAEKCVCNIAIAPAEHRPNNAINSFI